MIAQIVLPQSVLPLAQTSADQEWMAYCFLLVLIFFAAYGITVMLRRSREADTVRDRVAAIREKMLQEEIRKEVLRELQQQRQQASPRD